MKKLLVLMNHQLLEVQKHDAMLTLGVSECVFPPENIQNIWKNIPPDLENIFDVVYPVQQWLEEESYEDDVIIVQGDYGATVYIVSWAFANKRIPVYATTKRIYAQEIDENGHIINIHTFNHVRFRKYRLWK